MPPHPAQPTERVHPEQHPIPGKPSVGDHPGYMRLMSSKIHTGGEMYTCSANGLHPNQETALGIVLEYTVHTVPPRLRMYSTEECPSQQLTPVQSSAGSIQGWTQWTLDSCQRRHGWTLDSLQGWTQWTLDSCQRRDWWSLDRLQ